ncbi:hypothetical protein FDJ23_gp258 [Erwinia phage vB_EamM_Desertfox]|uniref:Uncharacterized protein n=4 Tax=Agricanvirus TaxID=1984776 RepID=A0A482IIZ2_9CAUD|nr:hypothetical protein FDJ23_gp258 [Erwinia phage vB_EamM_Desertfox]AUG86045.1 hypothetical protein BOSOLAPHORUS_259 [Erwinia phage vB_EamM_Bosolaphorus]AUG86365.1 hypothetical protein DESERTFOX_258 [Erwinia phage vB_EamM_Desertfox]AUG87011.1 hypothetical protein MORTIMER_263 [Erwinia phage vB_EamM_Mortimer]QBP07363.1 hypothetical protein REBECCA_258 [Erwinia phage Rebecca]
MALDQEYYEKALAVLASKGFPDKEADEIATTLSVYLPMRFIKAGEWALLSQDVTPVNSLALKHLELLERIPELKKPMILKMPTDFTYTTYGQEYCPGADAPVYKTGPDGYTHHPVGWESGITGVTGISGEDGVEIGGVKPVRHDFKYALPPELGLPKGVTPEQANYLKLHDLSDIEGIKRAYPDIDEETAQSLSAMQRKIDQRLGRAHRETRNSEMLGQRAQQQYRGSLFEKFLIDEPIGEPKGMTVKIMTHSIRNFGHGLQISTPLFGQSHKSPTGPQTMPGLEKGRNGHGKRKKKGKR